MHHEEQRYIRTRVVTGSKKESLRVKKGVYFVTVKEKPSHGKATERVREMLAEQLGTPLTKLGLIRGALSPYKTFLLVNHNHDENKH